MAKTLNALIYPHDPVVIVERRLIDLADVPPNKLPLWRPVAAVGDDAYDPATQIKSGPVTTIESNRVVDTWTIRAKTAAELDAEKDLKISAIDALQFAVHFDMENRVRVLEAKPQITAAQYRNALKARL